MSPSPHIKTDDQTSAFSNVVQFPTPEPPINIVNGRDLFEWMWKQLEQSGPQAPVSSHVTWATKNLFDSIHLGRAIMYPPIEWTVIFAEIHWNAPPDPDQHYCSASLLGFVGQLCETIIRDGGGRVPAVRACEMMMSRWDRPGAYIKYQERQNSTYLISTPLCARDLGAQVEVVLKDVPMNEECWSLTGSAEWP